MSTTIETRLERRIEASPRGLTIIETIRGDMIQAALTPDEARLVAAALTADQGGAGRDFSGVDWKAMYDQARRERDAALLEVSRVAREMARRVAAQRADFRDASSQHHWLTLQRDDARRERDAAVERAEAAERDRHAALMRVKEWKTTAGYLQAERDQLAEAAEATASHPAPAVTHADIVDAIIEATDDALTHAQDLAIRNAVWALVSGSDPAVYVVRESDLPEVVTTFDGDIKAGDYTWTDPGDLRASDLREKRDEHAAQVAAYEAVARAIDAEQAVDPVEAEVAMAWAEYRKDYQPNPDDLTAAHKAFTSGYLAARDNSQEARDE